MPRTRKIRRIDLTAEERPLRRIDLTADESEELPPSPPRRRKYTTVLSYLSNPWKSAEGRDYLQDMEMAERLDFIAHPRPSLPTLAPRGLIQRAARARAIQSLREDPVVPDRARYLTDEELLQLYKRYRRNPDDYVKVRKEVVTYASDDEESWNAADEHRDYVLNML